MRRPTGPTIIFTIIAPVIFVLLLAHFSSTGLWRIEYGVILLLAWTYAAAQQYRTGIAIDDQKQTLTVHSSFISRAQPIDLSQIHEVQYEIAYYLSTPSGIKTRRDIFTIFYADTSLVLREWNDPVYAQTIAITIAQAKRSDILSQRLSEHVTSYTFPEAGSDPRAVSTIG